MKKNEVLEQAKTITNGARLKEYGSPKENFERIAKLWSVLLEKEITPAQVSLCMIMVKMTRLIQTDTHEDSWVDIAGYAGCGAEVTDGLKNRGAGRLTGAEQSVGSVVEGKSCSHWGIHGTGTI